MMHARYRLSALAVVLLAACGASVCGQEPAAGGLVVLAQWVEPLDEARPTVRLRYMNSGSETLRFQLPADEEEMSAFAGLDVTVDGKDATYRSYDPTIDDPAYALVALEPGDMSEIVVDLSVLFKLPEDWRRLEASPVKVWWVPTVFATGVTMRRTENR